MAKHQQKKKTGNQPHSQADLQALAETVPEVKLGAEPEPGAEIAPDVEALRVRVVELEAELKSLRGAELGDQDNEDDELRGVASLVVSDLEGVLIKVREDGEVVERPAVVEDIVRASRFNGRWSCILRDGSRCSFEVASDE